jgi:hypothetical protein
MEFEWGDDTQRAPYGTLDEALAQATEDLKAGGDVESIRDDNGVVLDLAEIKASSADSDVWRRDTQADAIERSAAEDTQTITEDAAARAEDLRNG